MRSTPLRLTVVALVATLALAACGSSSSGSSAKPSTLTLGAEQEPDCFDWIGQCAGSQWGTWIAQIETVPMVFRSVPAGAPNSGAMTIVPGAVLTGEPTFVASPIETITYSIKPEAVWSDGVPITCADFQYVVDQQQHSKDVYDPTGYTDIDKVTCPTPKTAVVTYKKGTSYASWKSLFAGGLGLMPSHLLKGKNRDALLKNGYDWSGGPWIAKWTKGDNITLTQNPKYWGPKPKLAKVVFKFLTDTAAEFEAMKSGQVDAIYPQPQIDVVDQIAAGGLNDDNTVYNPNTSAVEGLWINNAKAPFDSLAVRKAFAYSIDRDALVAKLFGKLGVNKASNSFNPYSIAEYSDQASFAKYHLDLPMVTQLMTNDGWVKGADGVWAKNGKRAAFTVITTAGNKRRELTEQVLQTQVKAAGFDMAIKNQKSDDLFGTTLPSGNYQLSIYSSGLTSLIPGLCSQFCAVNIPTAANGNSGNNSTYVNIPTLDPLLETVDNSLNDQARRDAAKQADDIIADNVASLPLDPLPDILIWSKKITGPVQDNSIEGMFWNLDQWDVTK